MPTRVIKQPNGKLALFSSVVDHVLIYDCTYDEMYFFLTTEYHSKFSSKIAVEKIKNGIDDVPPYKHGVKGSGRDRWDHDMYFALIQHWHDEEVRRELLTIMADCGMSTEERQGWRDNAEQEALRGE